MLFEERIVSSYFTNFRHTDNWFKFSLVFIN